MAPKQADRITHYATPERESTQIIQRVSKALENEPMLSWFDALPLGMIVINQHRQIVYCNETFRALSGKDSRENVVGLRPGEALNCVNSTAVEAGCGCSDFCRFCGAAHAIIKSLNGTRDCQECRMTRMVDGDTTPLDLQIFTKPIEFEGEIMALVFAMDIRHELKLRYLNRTFHHGLINGIGGIATLTELIESAPSDSGLFKLLIESSQRTLKNILYHRDINAAEEGTLEADFETFEAGPFFDAIIAMECAFKNIQSTCVQTHISATTFTSDKKLLGHVIRNMLSNALEASGKSTDTITLDCQQDHDGTIAITMTNHGEIPKIIRKQMFKQYTSTKSRDRGLGNYVTKLFTEKYLGGRVEYTSGKGMTSFTLRLPQSENTPSEKE
ncbi:GHKL domain-containing protein [Pseudodesulfovibrio sp. JC047]|uniref:PAS domain-containing sensor histidine kinase n=1 Tax=Pseudodesulfovibrio sp. JC047 TaxID=2683199 RepID=UPI0013D3C603|nr:ATP-binding protein [Pseudodesulfovibrio sp. JC047]NDV20779.1 GHKL domain-containing protein [Pseudodesulfovibrio sp. JC047]